MTQQEADKIVMGMGCHPYSRLAMIDALLEGEKIGKREQKTIDIDLIPQLYVRWLMIDGEKPSWEEYASATIRMEQYIKSMEK